IELTQSTVAFIALAEEGLDGRRVYSMASDPMQRMPEDEVERIFASAALSGPRTNATWSRAIDGVAPSIRSTCAQALEAGGQSVGMFGVASESGYTAV